MTRVMAIPRTTKYSVGIALQDSKNYFLDSLFPQRKVLNAKITNEVDGSYIIALNDIDLVATGESEREAQLDLINQLIEYSEFYLEDLHYWKRANRKEHYPIVKKIHSYNRDINRIGALIEWQTSRM